MPGVVAAVYLGLILYSVACYFAFIYLVDPVWPFVVIGAGGIGVLLVIVVLVGTLLRAAGLDAPTVTPLDVRARLPDVRSNFERDRAWPNYLFAQGRTDLGIALA